jgi:hypothetical protein
MDKPLVFQAGRKKAARILFISIAFVAIGVWLIQDSPILGWLCIGFFGLGIPASIFMMRPNSTYLRLDSEGLAIVSMSRSSKIKWSEVQSFRLGTLHGTKMIAIEFSPQYTKHAAGRAFASALSGVEGAIADHYDTPIETICATLNEWKARTR